MRGYEDLFVIAAFGTAPETIYSRKKLTSLADLKGQKIRINNLMEAAGLAKLGALPVMLVFNDTSPALSSGQLDGATVPVAQLFDVGIGRFTTYHYLLPTSTAPLALVMSQKAFERLPQDAKTLIRKYGGEWLANQYATAYDAFNKQALERIKADARRTVVTPSAADLKTADDDFNSVRQDWVGESEQNRKLMTLVQTELANVRQHETTARRIEPQ